MKGNGLKTLFRGLGGGRSRAASPGSAIFVFFSDSAPPLPTALLQSVPSPSVSFWDPFLFFSLMVYFPEA